jgi:hypothetical protein
MSGRHGHGGHGGSNDEDLRMVPPHLDFGATSPFIERPLFALLLLNDEPSVQQYLRANLDAQKALLELTGAIGQVALRVRDAHGPKIVIDEHIKYYSAQEIWMFDLAIDVVAMLVTSGATVSDRDLILSDLRSADKHAGSRPWRHQVHKAGAGPAQFRQLRELIPHHQPLG